MKYLSEDQISALFAAIADKRDQALFRVAYHHGLRASEVGMLRLEDLRMGAGRIFVRRLKGSNSGEFPLLPAELASLRAWLRVRGAAPGAVFLSRNHRPISRKQIDLLMKKYGAAAGLPAELRHFHALKHSCATHMLARVRDLRLVQDWVGHKSIQNTEIYAKIWNAARTETAERIRDWGR